MNYTKWRNHTINAKIETDKKYLVLKMGDFLISTAGLGWYILYTLHGIRFAVENDFIPVVDWMNCKLPRYNADKVGKENVWEYFFEQPFHVTVEQAYESENFFVIDDVSKFDYSNAIDGENFIDFHNENVMEWRKYFQLYIRFKHNVKDYFEKSKKNQISEKDDYVGVLARGTDYVTLRPTGHLKAISIDEIFKQVDQCKNQSKIFLATEDEKIQIAFEDRYTQDVCVVDTKKYQEFGYNILNSISKDEDGYKRDLNYLYSIYVISKSQACVYTACGGGILASLMRKEEGRYYSFLCHGYNRAKGVIVGSYLEKMQNKIAWVGNKPLMFYSLNTLKLLCVDKIDIVVSQEVKTKYDKEVNFEDWNNIEINYIISDTYDIDDYMINNIVSKESDDYSKVILLYADYIIHGKDVIKEFSDKLNSLDGAYVWGVYKYPLNKIDNIRINQKRGIPDYIQNLDQPGNYSLIGRYIFDYDLKEIIKQILQKKSKFILADILNEYIKRKKLFFLEYTRGIICLKLESEDIMKKADHLICLLEELQMQKIGDFEIFKNIS